MGIIYIMLVASLCLAVFFLVAFLWAVKSGQFSDHHTPAMRILFDDKKQVKNKKQN